MSAASDARLSILQVKIKLRGVAKPPIWRRLLVPADLRLDRFHTVIQATMGWEDGHMHVFTTACDEWGLADPELGHRDERRMTLGGLLPRPGDRIRYTYDFGDDWEHEIAVDARLPAQPGRLYPTCVAGKSACPPEDCGGAWGYAHLREVLGDPSHEEHEDMVEWLGLGSGSEFDPATFDVEEVNQALAYLGAVR